MYIGTVFHLINFPIVMFTGVLGIMERSDYSNAVAADCILSMIIVNIL